MFSPVYININYQEVEYEKVKITVLKTTLDAELAKEYGVEGLQACPMLKAGQVFYADYAKPEGFCDEAWKAIYQYVFALAHGAEKGLFYYGDWIRVPGVAICSCNDGLRPSYSSWRQRTRLPRSIIRRCADSLIRNSSEPVLRSCPLRRAARQDPVCRCQASEWRRSCRSSPLSESRDS